MTYEFRSITPGYYACIPTYAIRSVKCTEVKVYNTDGHFKLIDNAKLKRSHKNNKLRIYTDSSTGRHYVPSISYMKYV